MAKETAEMFGPMGWKTADDVDEINVQDLWDDPSWDPRPWTDTECYLLIIWQKVLGLSHVGLQQDFFSLSREADQSSQLLQEVSDTFGVEMNGEVLRHHPTVESMSLYLDKACNGMIPDYPLCLKKGGGRLPVFFICGLYIYRQLSWLMAEEVPVFGISIPPEKTMIRIGKDGAPSWPGIPELASAYLERLLSVQPRGPYRLAGAAHGGLIAYEMARQLERLDEHVQLVALFDTHLPNTSSRRPLHWMKHQADTLMRDKGRHAWKRLKAIMADKRRPVPPEDLNWADVIKFRERIYQEAGLAYQRVPSKVRLQLFRAMEEHVPPYMKREETLGWKHLAQGPFEMHDISGDHMGLLERPGVEAVAENLQTCLDLLDCKKGETMI